MSGFRWSGRKRARRIDAGTANGRRRDGEIAVKREQGRACEVHSSSAALHYAQGQE